MLLPSATGDKPENHEEQIRNTGNTKGLGNRRRGDEGTGTRHAYKELGNNTGLNRNFANEADEGQVCREEHERETEHRAHRRTGSRK